MPSRFKFLSCAQYAHLFILRSSDHRGHPLSIATLRSQEAWFVTSFERGLRVIQAFDAQTPFLRLSDVAKKAGISRAAARRFLLTLQAMDYVGCDAGLRFYLRPKTLCLGYSFLSALRLPELLPSVLEDARKIFVSSCSLAVLDGTDIVYIARAAVHQPLQPYIRVGDRLPAHTTSLGRVLLSCLDDLELKQYIERVDLRAYTDRTLVDRNRLIKEIIGVRNARMCIVESERVAGLISLAMPIRNRFGRTVAAANISSQSRLGRLQMRKKAVPYLQRIVSEVELLLSRGGTPLELI